MSCGENTSCLGSEQLLIESQSLVSESGAYNLDIQSDGNLVLYAGGSAAIWATGTGGNAGAYVKMQNDCNLVVYSGDGTIVSTVFNLKM